MSEKLLRESKLKPNIHKESSKSMEINMIQSPKENGSTYLNNMPDNITPEVVEQIINGKFKEELNKMPIESEAINNKMLVPKRRDLNLKLVNGSSIVAKRTKAEDHLDKPSCQEILCNNNDKQNIFKLSEHSVSSMNDSEVADIKDKDPNNIF
jgi:hypothetical protein